MDSTLDLRPSLNRRLSDVCEGVSISRRHYLVFIGPGAYACCESLVESATKVFSALQQRNDTFRALNSMRSSGGEVMTRHASLQSRASNASCAMPDFGTHSAVVVIDSKGGPQPLPAYGQAQKRSSLLKITQVKAAEPSLLGRIGASNPYMSEGTLHSSEASEDDEELTRQFVKMKFCPVEYFSQEMPSCYNLDQWRHFCMLFLIDPRLEGSDAREMLSDLDRRLTEADKLISKFAKKFEVARALPLIGVILVHHATTTSAEETSKRPSDPSVSGFELISDADPEARTEPPSPGLLNFPLSNSDFIYKDDCESCTVIKNSDNLASNNGLACSGDFNPDDWGKPPLLARDYSSAAAAAPPLPEKFHTFLARMRKITRAKEGEPTHFTCNFDDEEELLQCLLQISSTAESLRKNEAHDLYEPDMSHDASRYVKPKCWRCEMM